MRKLAIIDIRSAGRLPMLPPMPDLPPMMGVDPGFMGAHRSSIASVVSKAIANGIDVLAVVVPPAPGMPPQAITNLVSSLGPTFNSSRLLVADQSYSSLPEKATELRNMICGRKSIEKDYHEHVIREIVKTAYSSKSCPLHDNQLLQVTDAYQLYTRSYFNAPYSCVSCGNST